MICDNKWLTSSTTGQGTLRPDLIESASHLASASASVIKTHHNDTNLIRQLRSQGRVIEPLAEYHKDEVRALGRDLGLPADLVERYATPPTQKKQYTTASDVLRSKWPSKQQAFTVLT